MRRSTILSQPGIRLALLPVLLLAITFAACTTDEPEGMREDGDMTEMNGMNHDNMGAMQGAAPGATADVRMENGVQVVDIEVGRQGYAPRQVTLEAGVPARLVFTRRIEGECPSQVQIPAFGIAKTDLPMHEPVAIEFTPDEQGTFTFVCGMDMMAGTLVVTS